MVNKEARRESRILAVEVLFAYFSRGEKISIKESFDHVLHEVAEKDSDAFLATLKHFNEEFFPILL